MDDRENTEPPADAAILLYTAQETGVATLEAERHRLAGLLQNTIIESLNLLLSQTRVYEQTLSTNPQAHMVASVLGNLARQTLQQARDLESSLRPTLLETLGLEPALDALANQIARTHGLQIHLAVERLRQRLPAKIELALFRAAQDALERAVHHAHASQATIRLAHEDNAVIFSVIDNGVVATGSETLRAARRRIQQLGGVAELNASPHGSLTLTIRFAFTTPAQLTPREMEVLQLLAQGLSNKVIAAALTISPRTVNFHLDNLYSKLGVNSRTEAAIYALRQEWF